MTELLIGGYGGGARRFILDGAGLRPVGDILRELPCASYGVWDRRRNILHLVEETSPGRLRSGRFVEGAWRPLADVETGGEAPCFVELNAEGKALAVANYANGSIALWRLDEEGLPSGAVAVQAEVGTGPASDRQDGPHAHCVRFRGPLLYSVDLGADSVFARPYSVAPARLATPFVAFAAPPGQGPRHLLFHPRLPVAYLLTELGSRLLTLDVGPDGRLKERASCSTLPAGQDGESLGGQLAFDPSGARLYASNRGHDSLAVFDLAANGDLALRRIVPTGAASPRHFAFAQAERALVVAHEEGDCLTVLDLAEDGAPGAIRQMVGMPRPAFVTCL